MTERKWIAGTRVKRFSSYNAMMLAESGNEVPTPDGDWVKYGDYKAAADIIADLYEALLCQDPFNEGYNNDNPLKSEHESSQEFGERLAKTAIEKARGEAQ